MDVNTDSLLIIFVHPWMGIFPETPQTLNTYTPRLFEVILEVWRLLKPELFEQVDAALCSEEKDLSIIKHGGGLSPSTATNQCYLVPLLVCVEFLATFASLAHLCCSFTTRCIYWNFRFPGKQAI